MFPESKSSLKNVEFKMADTIWRPVKEKQFYLALCRT